jgi:OmpA-OmpF porin, OOP family
MKGKFIVIGFGVLGVLIGSLSAQQNPRLDKTKAALDSLAKLEAPVFAPKSYAKAEERTTAAELTVKQEKSDKVIDKYLTEAEEYVENAFKATEVAKLTFRDYLAPRNKAREANAPQLVPALYQQAEEQFMKGTAKAEDGNVKDGLKEATAASPLFDTAELEAIRVQILGQADSLINRADAGEAPRYAPATLDKARSARARCDALITKDRYDRASANAEAALAEYEARHASTIAQSVRSLERNDQAWEKLMLIYEVQMDRVGASIGLTRLPFEDGPTPAADTLIGRIKNLSAQSGDREKTNRELTDKLRSILGKLGADQSSEGPLLLADRVDVAVIGLTADRDRLAGQISDEKSKLTRLEEQHAVVAAELESRTAEEGKFRKAKEMLNPSEGEVLYNAANDLVLRLSGLSFDIGKSDIKDAHVPLLEKVRTVIEMFPESKLTVEGHTDASGDPKGNLQLSEKRAYAVMQYLRQTMLLSADRISAIGYGSEKPVAPNETAEGRAKNRRIDIIIMK